MISASISSIHLCEVDTKQDREPKGHAWLIVACCSTMRTRVLGVGHRPEPQVLLPQAEVPGGFCHSIHGIWTWPAQGSDRISPDCCLPATAHGQLGMPCALEGSAMFSWDKSMDRDAPDACKGWECTMIVLCLYTWTKHSPTSNYIQFNYPKKCVLHLRCPVFYHLVNKNGPYKKNARYTTTVSALVFKNHLHLRASFIN